MKKELNPEHLAKLIKTVNSSPCFSLLDIRLTELGYGSAKAETVISKKHLNPFGTVHGGVYAALLDTAAYWAAYCGRDEDVGFTSMDVSVTNLAMVSKGRLTATATSVKEGKSMCLCQAAIHDDCGRLVAHGTSRLLILHGKQSIADLTRTMGCQSIPPKFIPCAETPHIKHHGK